MDGQERCMRKIAAHGAMRLVVLVRRRPKTGTREPRGCPRNYKARAQIQEGQLPLIQEIKNCLEEVFSETELPVSRASRLAYNVRLAPVRR